MITFRVTSAFLLIGMLFNLCDSFTYTHPSLGISHKSPLFTHQPTLQSFQHSFHTRTTNLQSSPDFQSENGENKNKLLSLTALRASLRLSIAAMRTTLRGLTGISVTTTMKVLVGLFPTWVSKCDSISMIIFKASSYN